MHAHALEFRDVPLLLNKTATHIFSVWQVKETGWNDFVVSTGVQQFSSGMIFNESIASYAQLGIVSIEIVR